MASRGFVSLVGAGPGDPDYLTLKALRRLQEAELVLYDALVSGEVVALAANALCINVGKRARREQTPQQEIERLLIEGAQQGLRVVRLKGGDPFVFGRGGEEALALQRAGIPFEVVPGVTTAIAAPALAGIPVTHRGVSSGFIVLTGSDLESIDRVLASIAPASLTIVVLMGMAVRARVVELLVSRGWDPGTPAAIVLGAATPEMRSWRGRLSDLSSASLPASSAPGTIVIGAVAALPVAIGDVRGVAHVGA
jgi:uroporphyrin-III C-methyltransferase